MQAVEMDQAMQLAVVHHMPALVVHQQLVAGAYSLRIRRQGRFKIVVPIDWPRGEIYGMLKLRGMTTEMMQADGYEIMLTAGRTEAEIHNEAKVLTDFIRNQISLNAEVRFVLGCLTRAEDDVLCMARIMKSIPSPALLRTDHHLKMQVTKANVRTHSALLEKLQAETGVPIKLSGNIDSIRTIAGCVAAGASRFAVNLNQAQAIVRDIQRQPDELRQLLEEERPARNSEQARAGAAEQGKAEAPPPP
jgi:hypothetical protein